MTTDRPTRAVLLVEDESIIAHDIQQILVELGYEACGIASSAEEAVARASERRPDVALVDIRIRGKLDGIKTAQLLQQSFGIPVIYLTAHADDVTVERAARTHPYGYLLKPVKPSELKGAIEIAVESHAMDTRAGRRPAVPAAGAHRPTAPDVTATAEEGRLLLQQVLQSDDFDASRRSRDFLRFIVDETLAGRGDALTQAAIATSVFGRKDDFDPVVDPIVRIQAGRLRRSLERYYLLSGKNDSVRIELPKGTYVPVFRSVANDPTAAAVPLKESPAGERPDGWPAVAVNEFETVPGSRTPQELAIRLQEELAIELGRYRDVRVVRSADLSERHGARFTLAGRIHSEDGAVRVTARLVDHESGAQAWGNEYRTPPGSGAANGSLDDVARVIAAGVGSEEGVIVQHLAREYRLRGSVEATPYDAILRSQEFFLARQPGDFERAVLSLQRLVAADPGCGLAWTRLARLYVTNFALEVAPTHTGIDDAVDFAQRGVRVDPTSRDARCLLAAALLMKGELAAGRDQLEEALRLDPRSLVYLETIGWLMALLGDWERGIALARTAVERNPHCLAHVSVGLWADHIRRGEFEEAHRVALDYRDGTFFWRALMRACCLGHLGRPSEAAVEAAELLRQKPDFGARGITLIGRLIKFPDLASRIVEGLARAGVELR
jgi:adenylate cyclase